MGTREQRCKTRPDRLFVRSLEGFGGRPRHLSHLTDAKSVSTRDENVIPAHQDYSSINSESNEVEVQLKKFDSRRNQSVVKYPCDSNDPQVKQAVCDDSEICDKNPDSISESVKSARDISCLVESIGKLSATSSVVSEPVKSSRKSSKKSSAKKSPRNISNGNGSTENSLNSVETTDEVRSKSLKVHERSQKSSVENNSVAASGSCDQTSEGPVQEACIESSPKDPSASIAKSDKGKKQRRHRRKSSGEKKKATDTKKELGKGEGDQKKRREKRDRKKNKVSVGSENNKFCAEKSGGEIEKPVNSSNPVLSSEKDTHQSEQNWDNITGNDTKVSTDRRSDLSDLLQDIYIDDSITFKETLVFENQNLVSKSVQSDNSDEEDRLDVREGPVGAEATEVINKPPAHSVLDIDCKDSFVMDQQGSNDRIPFLSPSGRSVNMNRNSSGYRAGQPTMTGPTSPLTSKRPSDSAVGMPRRRLCSERREFSNDYGTDDLRPDVPASPNKTILPTGSGNSMRPVCGRSDYDNGTFDSSSSYVPETTSNYVVDSGRPNRFIHGLAFDGLATSNHPSFQFHNDVSVNQSSEFNQASEWHSYSDNRYGNQFDNSNRSDGHLAYAEYSAEYSEEPVYLTHEFNQNSYSQYHAADSRFVQACPNTYNFNQRSDDRVFVHNQRLFYGGQANRNVHDRSARGPWRNIDASSEMRMNHQNSQQFMPDGTIVSAPSGSWCPPSAAPCFPVNRPQADDTDLRKVVSLSKISDTRTVMAACGRGRGRGTKKQSDTSSRIEAPGRKVELSTNPRTDNSVKINSLVDAEKKADISSLDENQNRNKYEKSTDKCFKSISTDSSVPDILKDRDLVGDKPASLKSDDNDHTQRVSNQSSSTGTEPVREDLSNSDNLKSVSEIDYVGDLGPEEELDSLNNSEVNENRPTDDCLNDKDKSASDNQIDARIVCLDAKLKSCDELSSCLKPRCSSPVFIIDCCTEFDSEVKSTHDDNVGLEFSAKKDVDERVVLRDSSNQNLVSTDDVQCKDHSSASSGNSHVFKTPTQTPPVSSECLKNQYHHDVESPTSVPADLNTNTAVNVRKQKPMRSLSKFVTLGSTSSSKPKPIVANSGNTSAKHVWISPTLRDVASVHVKKSPDTSTTAFYNSSLPPTVKRMYDSNFPSLAGSGIKTKEVKPKFIHTGQEFPWSPVLSNTTPDSANRPMISIDKRDISPVLRHDSPRQDSRYSPGGFSSFDIMKESPVRDWRRQHRDRLDSSSVPYIDSHCHIDFLFNRSSYRGSWTDYMEEFSVTFMSNYEGCVTNFCDPNSYIAHGKWRSLLEVDGVWAAFGCHPKSVNQFSYDKEMFLRNVLSHPKVKALGEIGLDYSGRFGEHAQMQKEAFEKQLEIALKYQMPLVIHCRQAEVDCLEIMKKLVPHDWPIHRHCFTDNWETAQPWLDYFTNCYIGLTPLVTYKKAREVHEVAYKLPLNRLLLETDAPYFIPSYVSRKQLEFNSPGLAICVADEVSTLRDVPLDEVLSAARANTRKVYRV